MTKTSKSFRQDSRQNNKSNRKLNPFEIHTNKEKSNVLGKKKKTEGSCSRISKKKVFGKRRNAILKECSLQNKVNKFLDNRIGEHLSEMTTEDRIGARFAAVRVKVHNRKSLFNLADEVLTHHGQTLNEIEVFENPLSDEEYSDDGDKLDTNFVKNVHFGGGILKQSNDNREETYKNFVDALISESKRRKAEKQISRENTLALTEKLDSEWKDLMPLVNKHFRTQDNIGINDYDKTLKELQFEALGCPTKFLNRDGISANDRLKHQQKVQMDNVQKDFDKQIWKYNGAEDLDDNFVRDSRANIYLTETEEFNIENGDEILVTDRNENFENHVSDDLDDKSNCSQKQEFKQHSNHNNKNVYLNNLQEKNKLSKIVLENINNSNLNFSLPNTYQELQNILINQPCYNQSIIIQKWMQSYNGSLNKNKLEIFLKNLLKYLDYLGCNIQNEEGVKEYFSVFAMLLPDLFEIVKSSNNMTKLIVEIIKKKQMDYVQKRRMFPGLEVLIFLKLASLFCTSDFPHAVITPCVIFIDQMLTTCKIQAPKDVAYGLFLVTLVLEYTLLTKRYLPSALQFLCGVLHMTIPKSGIKLLKVASLFSPFSTDLVLLDNYDTETAAEMDVLDLLKCFITEDFKVKCLFTSLKLLKDFSGQIREIPSHCELLEIAKSYLQLLPIYRYPKEIQNYYENLLSTLNNLTHVRTLKYIIRDEEKPKALRLYEPNIQKIYDVKINKVIFTKNAKQTKLFKLRKEYKGAIKELRRDGTFFRKVKINQHIQSDKERLEKVKKIYAESITQQGELNV